MNMSDFKAELRCLIIEAEEDNLLPELVRDELIAAAEQIAVAIRLPPPEALALKTPNPLAAPPAAKRA